MKWFKHYSNVASSESLNKFRQEQGIVGLGRYWILIEYLASQFDGSDTKFSVSFDTLRGMLEIFQRKHLGKFLESFGKVSGVFIKVNESFVVIDAPILLELQSRDFKLTRKDRAKTAPRVDKDKEEIKNKIKNKININQNGLKPADIESLWNSQDLLTRCTKLSESRISKAKSQIKKYPDLSHWKKALDALLESEFCRETWKPGFDDFLNEGKRIKAIEGFYKDSKKQKPKTFAQIRSENNTRLFMEAEDDE